MSMDMRASRYWVFRVGAKLTSKHDNHAKENEPSTGGPSSELGFEVEGPKSFVILARSPSPIPLAWSLRSESHALSTNLPEVSNTVIYSQSLLLLILRSDH
jgi:hypothetical protein